MFSRIKCNLLCRETCELLKTQKLPEKVTVLDVAHDATGTCALYHFYSSSDTSTSETAISLSSRFKEDDSKLALRHLSMMYVSCVLNDFTHTHVTQSARTHLLRLEASARQKAVLVVLWSVLAAYTRAALPHKSKFDFSEQLCGLLYRCSGDEERASFLPTAHWWKMMGLQLDLVNTVGDAVLASRTQTLMRLMWIREQFHDAIVDKVEFQRQMSKYFHRIYAHMYCAV
jgi:hypothetical protein